MIFCPLTPSKPLKSTVKVPVVFSNSYPLEINSPFGVKTLNSLRFSSSRPSTVTVGVVAYQSFPPSVNLLSLTTSTILGAVSSFTNLEPSNKVVFSPTPPKLFSKKYPTAPTGTSIETPFA